MNKKYILLLIITTLTFSAYSQTTQVNPDKRYFEINKNIDVFNTLLRELDIYYVDSLDITKTVQTGIVNMLAGLDPYTTYIEEEEMDDFKFMTTGEYAGIGSYIVAREYKDKVAVMISEPNENMPAAKSGLKAGDIILAIDDVDMTKEGTLEKVGRDLSSTVSNTLKGKAGTEIKIKIDRPGAKKPIEVKVKRENIHVNSVPYYGILTNNIGYISFSTFTSQSAQEVKDAFLDLKKQGITSLILDIRNNGGGLLDDAVQIVNLFTPKGEVVLSTKGRTKRSERIYRTTLAPTDTDIPIAVLVNRGSASSSEILSGALQDMDRAVIVGQRTYGKGLVQATRELPYGGSLKVTISKYYIPSGRCIQAIDYTNRNEDGSVGRIPDSLTTEFKTAGGRIVRDGGGILPDVEVEAEKIPTMIYYLVNEQIIFDFVTNWCIDRPKIESIENFKLTDSDYEAFKTFVKTKDFKYDRGSEKALEVLKEYMEMEGYDKTASAEYKALMDKLVPDVERDLDAFKPEISKFIVSEIAKRYYYNRGEILEQLKTDKEVAKAVEILNDSATYKKILSPAE